MESRHGTMTTTVIDTNGAVPMLYYMLLADIVALIVATILAAPFAREADGHLEIALTKPISKVRYALGAIGADVVGIVAASFITVVAFYLCQLLFESARARFQRDQHARDRDGHRRSAGLVRDAVRRHDVAPPVVRRRARIRLAGRRS